MSLTDIEAEKLNNSSPVDQKVSTGTEIKANQDGLVVNTAIDSNQPLTIAFPVTADATGGLAITIPYAMTIYDVIVVATVANGSGTLTLKNGATAITDAIACVTDKAVARAGTIDNAVSSITTATTMTVVSAGAGDRGIVYITGI